MKNKVIFLCTGNICRSPMGEALLKHAIAARPKTSPIHSLEIVSAGTSAVDGMPPSANSVSALVSVGIDISSYRATSLTQSMLDECYALFAMSRSHLEEVKNFYKNPPERMFTVCQMIPDCQHPDIPDPYGGTLSEYIEVRDEIARAIPYIVKYLSGEYCEFIDRGPETSESVDYPDFAKLVCDDVNSGRASLGVLICTSGIGMSIAANKIRGIRAALCLSEDAAKFSRLHNNANVVCLGAKYLTPTLAESIVKIFSSTEFEGGRHERRVCKMMDFENL